MQFPEEIQRMFSSPTHAPNESSFMLPSFLFLHSAKGDGKRKWMKHSISGWGSIVFLANDVQVR